MVRDSHRHTRAYLLFSMPKGNLNPADAYRESSVSALRSLMSPRQGTAQKRAQKGTDLICCFTAADSPRLGSRTRPVAQRPATLLLSRRTLLVCLCSFFVFLAFDCPTELEEEINQLQSTNGDKARLTELKTELGKINKKKEEYVKEHPEKRNLVYRRYRKQADDNTTAQPDKLPKRNLFNEQGLPRHPERSIYYDPVLTPFGVSPPGMPYLERRELFVIVSYVDY